MGRKVFLDVGCNTGQSLEAALNFDFDVIYCFEPVMRYCDMLNAGTLSSNRGSHGASYVDKQYNQDKVVICPYGLWVQDETLTIYSPHTMAASVFSDHQDNEGGNEDCDFVKASDWCKNNLQDDDFVVMKMNCEGSECTILDHLIDEKAIHYIDHVMIDFDAYKIPSQAHRPQWTLGKLAKHNVDFTLCDDVMRGSTHYDRICSWLEERVPQVTKNV